MLSTNLKQKEAVATSSTGGGEELSSTCLQNPSDSSFLSLYHADENVAKREEYTIDDP